MALPNQINPKFTGQVTASSYEATHGNGISCTAITLAGATAKYFFGSTANGFTGTVTGVYLVTIGATGSTVTVKGSAGATIATITGASSAGGLSGPASALSNTAITLTGTISAVSGTAGDTSIVFLTYQTDER